MAGVALLPVSIVAALAICHARGFCTPRTVLGSLGILLGGTIGAVPGAYLSIQMIVFHATGTGQVPFYLQGEMPFVYLVAGGAVGALVGLLGIDWYAVRKKSPKTAWISALAGFGIGGLASFAALILGQNTEAELTILILIPLATATAMLAGYSLRAAKQ
jgi:hypothetical protein